MARTVMMAKGLVSILITVALILAFVTGLGGEEEEGGLFGEEGGHVLWAYILVFLFLVHLALNYRMFINEMRSFLRKGTKD